MEATLVLQNSSPFLTRDRRRLSFPAKRYPSVMSIQTRPAGNVDKVSSSKNSIVYEDNWFDRLAINHLSRSVQSATGLRNNKSGYESLVEAARQASQNFNPIEQRGIVIEALDKAFPKPITNLIRTLLPNSKFAREYFAVFTTLFFPWLVGPCEVKESEQKSGRERNFVHVKKCRFLEESNCVGMCINLCKVPSQDFIKNSFGIPVNMVPNFDDLSCEMRFGEEPPAITEDPVFKQPCYKRCKAIQKHSASCSS